MKKIALFGASGRSGKAFLNQALDKGYKIKALVRNPSGLEIENSNLEIIKGDVLELNWVKKTIEDTDIVISLSGHVKNSPKNIQSAGTKNIIKSMEELGVKEIISLSGGALPYPEKDQPKFIDYLIRGIMGLLAKDIVVDAKNHAELLKASKLDWTIVRAPRLTLNPRKGTYRIGWVGVNSGTELSREDLADFIIKQIENTDYKFQMPFVSY